MNIYNHLFYWVYSRQKTNYGRNYGVFSASMVLTLAILVLLLDLQIALELLNVEYYAFKPIPAGLVMILLIFGLNCLYYYSHKRHINIEKKYLGITSIGLRRARIAIIVLLVFLVVFFFIGSNIAHEKV